jgi:hypothetical protein
MYLIRANSAHKPTRLGAYLIDPRTRRLTGMRGLGSYLIDPRRARLRGLRGLGDSGYSDPITGEWVDTSGQSAGGAIGPGILQPAGPYPTGQSILNQMASQAVVDQNPTDYVSPQSAKAAGVNAAVVDAAWAQGLARYSTQAAAIAAGIAPAVVTQYWPQSRQYAAVAAPPTMNLSLFSGISSKTLLLGAAAIVALGLFSGGKRR